MNEIDRMIRDSDDQMTFHPVTVWAVFVGAAAVVAMVWAGWV